MVKKSYPYYSACCGGILDYVYHYWFRCRNCGRWVRRKW